MAKWEELSIADRAQYMRVAVKNGYRDIRSIREAYNKYEDGGNVDKQLEDINTNIVNIPKYLHELSKKYELFTETE